jgi:energy-coupling factor transporter ATP-binding protein EcfA2
MRICRLKINGFRGANQADISLGQHTVLVGPNNSGKTTIIEALALLLGRDRLVPRLTEHDFFGSDPVEDSRIIIVATVTGFEPNDHRHHREWFGSDRGVEKWLDPSTGQLYATKDKDDWLLAVRIGCAARFDIHDLEAEIMRFFVDDDEFGDPFAEGGHLQPVRARVLQELGFFLATATRTWDRWISFSSESLFRRIVGTLGGLPAEAIRGERGRLWKPAKQESLEAQPGLSDIVAHANAELAHLLSAAPNLQLRLTSTDSSGVLEAVIPHYQQDMGPTLPTARQGSGLVSLQSLLLLMQLGRARAENNQSFVLAVEEPELHIQPSQQKRLVNRLNALCDQTITTTHSPLVASMFPPADMLFVSNVGGQLNAAALADPSKAQPSNHEQRLFFAWRQKLVEALMHDHVLIPEGVSDVAWLEALQAAVEMHQVWTRDTNVDPTRFGTFIGIAPTTDAKISDTYEITRRVHHNVSALVDGDQTGMGYLENLKTLEPPPRIVLVWPAGWDIERTIAWIAEANAITAFADLGTALGEELATPDALAAHFRSKKTYVPTHQTVAEILAADQKCLKRLQLLLGAISDIIRGLAQETPVFDLSYPESTVATSVFRLKI